MALGSNNRKESETQMLRDLHLCTLMLEEDSTGFDSDTVQLHGAFYAFTDIYNSVYHLLFIIKPLQRRLHIMKE